MKQFIESLKHFVLDFKNLTIVKSSIIKEDLQRLTLKSPDNFLEYVQKVFLSKWESLIGKVKKLDWSARVFEIVYTVLMIGLTLVLLTNYFLGQNPDFLGFTTEGITWFYLFIVFFSGLLTLPFAKLKTIFPILIGYLVYFPLLFLIEWSRQLNNPDFELEQLYEVDQITQVHFYSLLIILVIAFALRLVQKEFYIFKRFESTGLYRARRSVWTMASMAPLMVTNRLFLEYVNPEIITFAENNKLEEYFKFITPQTFLWFTVGFVLFASFYSSLKEIALHRFGKSNVFFSSFVFATVFNIFFQAGLITGSDLLGKYIFPQATLFQIIAILLISVLVYVIINRFLYATLLIFVTGSIFSIINIIKFKYRQEPLIPTDFVWITEPELFLSFVNPSYFFTCVTILGLIFYLSWNFQILLPSKKVFSNLLERFFVLLGLVFIFNQTLNVFRSEENGKVRDHLPVISSLNNQYNVTWMGLSTNASYKSLAYVWSKQLTQEIIEKPNDYSEDNIRKILKKYISIAQDINLKRSNSIGNQTVIFVLSESFSDPRRIPKTKINQNPIPNIDRIKNETTSGLMHSDGFGGGTANMEFQSLTGLPFYNFSASTSNIYVEVVPKMKFVPSISRAFTGENSYVIHPSSGSNYNRINIYSDLGFENLLFFKHDAKDNKLNNLYLQGVNISDKSIYDNVLSRINTTQSQFFSVITMQNHVPWSEVKPETLTASNEFFNDQQNNDLLSYSRLLTFTDQATSEFLESLKQIDKQITVIFYGDHLPGFYPLDVFSESPNLQFETDYFIWSNKNDSKVEHSMINSSDFGAVLLEKTNSKVSPYYALLDEVLRGRQLSEEGQFNRDSEAERDLAMIQYDITSGKGISLETPVFFEVP